MTTETPSTDRASLHALVDALPESDLADVRQLLKTFAEADPALRTALLASYDDEPFTEEDRVAVAEAQEGYRRGEWVSNEEMKRQLGL